MLEVLHSSYPHVYSLEVCHLRLCFCHQPTVNDPCAPGHIWCQLLSTCCITNTTFVSVSSCGLLKWDATPLEWYSSSSLGLPSLSGSLLSSVTYLGGFFNRSQRKLFNFCSHLKLSNGEGWKDRWLVVGHEEGYTITEGRHVGRLLVEVCDGQLKCKCKQQWLSARNLSTNWKSNKVCNKQCLSYYVSLCIKCNLWNQSIVQMLPQVAISNSSTISHLCNKASTNSLNQMSHLL